MSSGAVALTIAIAIVAIGAAVGLSAGLRRKMDLEQWTVAGRGFGPLLMYLLMAGEVYTTASFLGLSGWAYSRGGPTLYMLAYLPLASVVSFFILPPLWQLGRDHALQTEADFFNLRYGNKFLAALVAILGIAFLIPYLQLQLTGLGIIVSIASFDSIGQGAAICISVVLLNAFVFAGGVRAVAWVAILKDVLMLAAVLSVGLAIPYIHFGGIAPMFAALAKAHPAHLTMPGATPNLGHTWYVTTVVLNSLGGYIWPHSFATAFTARNVDTIRRNAVIMPIYTALLAFVFFVGVTAVLVLPNLSNGDLSLLTLARQSFPPWFLGFIGGAGALTAMVPASILLISAATLFSKNLVRSVFAPSMPDQKVAMLARVMVMVLSVTSVLLAIFSSTTLVSLLLLGYAGVTQFFPGVVLGLFWKRVTMRGVLIGLVSGELIAAMLMLTNGDAYHGWNAGFIALCLNFAITVGVSLRQPAGALQSNLAAVAGD